MLCSLAIVVVGQRLAAGRLHLNVRFIARGFARRAYAPIKACGFHARPHAQSGAVPAHPPFWQPSLGVGRMALCVKAALFHKSIVKSPTGACLLRLGAFIFADETPDCTLGAISWPERAGSIET
jgi:hypothetical protein